MDVTKETIIYGTVTKDGAPVPGAYVRLLDGTGEFTAEVLTSITGNYRFFAARGDWTLSVMHSSGSVRRQINAAGPGLVEASMELA